MKLDGDFVEVNLDKNLTLKNGVKSNYASMRKTTNINRISGSMFNILSEEADIMMTEGDVQGNNKASGNVNHKGKAVLTEITNQTSNQCEKKVTKSPSQGSKKNCEK